MWVLICTELLTVCSCHAMYAFQSESTLYSCLNVNVKELLAQNRHDIRYQIVFRYRACFEQEVPWISGNCRVWIYLKGVHRMIRTYSQMLRTGKYSRHSSIIWSVWLTGWVFVYELRDYGFESRCCHVIFRYHTCFEQGVPWYSGNCRVRINSEIPMWHDKNIQSFFLYSGKLL